mmetsp:Transcript_85/g.159  ORF Transcript_85/g.159 Transcript_85/m.159 type:complete len:484 (+) Transcript_85:46-1497(+)
MAAPLAQARFDAHGTFPRNMGAPGSYAGSTLMDDSMLAGNGVHMRSSKVRSIAEEISELENRYRFLEDRNKWLSARLLREKQTWIDSFMMSNAATRKKVFFRAWKEMMHELRLEKALSIQTAALSHCQEAADSLGKVLSQEQAARRSVEAQGRRTLQELERVQDSAAGLERNVGANDNRIWQLTQQLEQAEGLISSGRQAAKAVLEQMDAHDKKMAALGDSRKAFISEDAMNNSRKVRSVAKDTLQQVSGLLPPKESSPESKTPQVRWQTQREEYTLSPPRIPTSPSEMDKLEDQNSRQERQRLQLQLERQMQQLEHQRSQRQLERQKMEQEQAMQRQSQREQSMQQQQQHLQKMHQERMQANLQQQKLLQQVEQDRLQYQAMREAEGRPSSSSNSFQVGADDRGGNSPLAAPVTRGAPQPILANRTSVSRSVSPTERKRGERKMLISTGPAVMRGASGTNSPMSPAGAARPASVSEPWWYGQ